MRTLYFATKFDFVTYDPELHKEKVKNYCYFSGYEVLVCAPGHITHKDLMYSFWVQVIGIFFFCLAPDKAGKCDQGEITSWVSHEFGIYSNEVDQKIMKALQMDARDPRTDELVKREQPQSFLSRFTNFFKTKK